MASSSLRSSWMTISVRAPRDLKYAVLHLQAATEVLLKARLLQDRAPAFSRYVAFCLIVSPRVARQR
jgi:hypothetical protein